MKEWINEGMKEWMDVIMNVYTYIYMYLGMSQKKGVPKLRPKPLVKGRIESLGHPSFETFPCVVS